MPTLKKSIKAVRDALKEAEKQLERKAKGSEFDYTCEFEKLSGKIEGLRLARRIIDGVFPGE